MSMAAGISQPKQGMAQGMAPKRDSHQTSSRVSTQLKDIQKTLPLRVLSKDDWQHWTTQGYVIVRQAVPAANVERPSIDSEALFGKASELLIHHQSETYRLRITRAGKLILTK